MLLLLNHVIRASDTESGNSDAVVAIADPVLFFSKEYDDNNGRVQVIASGEKSPASPCRKSASTAQVASPTKKRSNTTSSPARTDFNAAARVVVAAVGAAGRCDISLPPVSTRVYHSPLLVVAVTTPSNATPRKPYVDGPAMIDLVLKTQLLPWLQNPKPRMPIPTKNPAKMKSEIQVRRSNMFYHFSKAGKMIMSKNNVHKLEVDLGYVTRSRVDNEEDWRIDRFGCSRLQSKQYSSTEQVSS